ncbi:MAG: hypothetical protein PV344_01610 [Anaplasma sp.]|nr:hypothetical protein [Anaplasma sp.]
MKLTVYCKRLNFREDLIFANFAIAYNSQKLSPTNSSDNMSTLRKLHSIREN